MDQRRHTDYPPVVSLDVYRQRGDTRPPDPWEDHAAEYRAREAERAAQRARHAAEIAAQRQRATVAPCDPWFWLSRRRGGR